MYEFHFVDLKLKNFSTQTNVVVVKCVSNQTWNRNGFHSSPDPSSTKVVVDSAICPADELIIINESVLSKPEKVLSNF